MTFHARDQNLLNLRLILRVIHQKEILTIDGIQ